MTSKFKGMEIPVTANYRNAVYVFECVGYGEEVRHSWINDSQETRRVYTFKAKTLRYVTFENGIQVENLPAIDFEVKVSVPKARKMVNGAFYGKVGEEELKGLLYEALGYSSIGIPVFKDDKAAGEYYGVA